MSTKDGKGEAKAADTNTNIYAEQIQFIVSKGIEEDMDSDLEDYYQSI